MSAALPASTAIAALRCARARHATAWRWLRLAGPLIIGLQVVALATAHPRPGLHGPGLAVAAGVAVFAAAGFGALVMRRRPGPIRVACVALFCIASLVLARIQPHGPGILGMFVAIAFVARRLPTRWSGAAGVLVMAVLAVRIQHHPGQSTVADLVTGIAMVSLYALTNLALQLTAANDQAAELLAELERSRDAQAHAAALAERQRMAREMHDILAHSLSGLLLQLEAARLLVRHRPGDERVPAAIARAHELARSGLAEARNAIGTLRDESLPGPEELPRLTAQFEQDTGIACTVAITGEQKPLSPQIRLAVFRVAQESLTNAVKHARPTAVTVALAYGTDEVRLVVENDAAGSSGAPGYGLAGMRERAELLGGTLQISGAGGRFRVELAVPA